MLCFLFVHSKRLIEKRIVLKAIHRGTKLSGQHSNWNRKLDNISINCVVEEIDNGFTIQRIDTQKEKMSFLARQTKLPANCLRSV